MITLATLSQATEQEIFDQVINHFHAQGCRAYDEKLGCRYRMQDGDRVLKCAAGCLIADVEYHPAIESKAWHELLSEMPEAMTQAHACFISALQNIHDSADDFAEMMSAYEVYAVVNNLTFPKGGDA